MSTRKPAASTVIKGLQAQVTKLEAELKRETQAKDSFYKLKQDAEAEIEQVHALLDVLPGSAARKTDGVNSWEQKEITAMTRLASYLALRGAHA